MTPSAVCDGGTLDCNGGLLIAIRRALKGIDVGGILEIRSRNATVADDLPPWCGLAGHRLEQVDHDGPVTSYFVRKGR